MAPNYESDEMESGTDEESVESAEEVTQKKRSKKAWKDPNKPKRAMSAFFLYSQAHRAGVKESHPEAAFGDIARILARQFKELPDKEKVKWTKKADEDKARYQGAMKSYVPSEDPTGGGGGRGRKKAKKDPSAPKRNMSAYFLYSIAARPMIKEENPDASFGDIARIISARFKELSDSEKKNWQDKAAKDKIRYEREMAAYKGE